MFSKFASDFENSLAYDSAKISKREELYGYRGQEKVYDQFNTKNWINLLTEDDKEGWAMGNGWIAAIGFLGWFPSVTDFRVIPWYDPIVLILNPSVSEMKCWNDVNFGSPLTGK